MLKSGCQVEALQLEKWDRLERAVPVNVALAARIVSIALHPAENPPVRGDAGAGR